MALNIDQRLLESLLSNHHAFTPKITLTDRARVKQVVSPTPLELPFESTKSFLEDVEIINPHLFSSITYNEKQYIFMAAKRETVDETYSSGPAFNEIYYTTYDGSSFSAPVKLDLVFDVDFISCFEVYYNDVCGQFGLVYSGYSLNENNEYYSKCFLKRLMMGDTITQYDETLLDTGINFFTTSCLNENKLVVIGVIGNTKKSFILDLSLSTLINEAGRCIAEKDTTSTMGNVVNLKSCNVGNEFYYIEIIVDNGLYATNLYDTYTFGYYPYKSSVLFNSIYHDGNNLILTSSTEDTMYKIYKTNLDFAITDMVYMNGNTTSAPVFNACNYLIFGDYVLYDYSGVIYYQSTNYEIKYREENTEITIPQNRIRDVSFESVSENLKTRNIKITLNNDDGFFTVYGVDENGFEYKNYFNSTRTSLRKISFYIADNFIKDADGNIIYEKLYTGFLNAPADNYKGTITMTCVDGLDIMKRAICKPKKYSYISGEEYVKDLCRQAGFEDVIFEVPTNYTVKEMDLDRRQNVLDSVKKLLDICTMNMYFDRDGRAIVTQRLMYKENIMEINNRHVVNVESLEYPSIEYTRNIVRIITDNVNDVYVEARDEEAIANMGYESVMELDYTGFFAIAGNNKKENYEYPSAAEIESVIKEVSPMILGNDPNALTFAKVNCGLFPYHGRHLYLLRTTNNGNVDDTLVACENELSFALSNKHVYAYSQKNEPVGINAYGRCNHVSNGILNRTDYYIPKANNPYNGCDIKGYSETLSVIKLYPNREYFSNDSYKELPKRTGKMDFTKDLLKHLRVDCKLEIDTQQELYFTEFMKKYNNVNYELFYYAVTRNNGELANIISRNQLPFSDWNLIAIKKDLTYIEGEPDTFSVVKKEIDGRYGRLVMIDGIAKEVTIFGKDGKDKTSELEEINFIDWGGYGCVDFAWHKPTDVVANGMSAQDIANKILKQVCRTNMFVTFNTTPLFFLTPEDVVYINLDRIQGYFIIKSIKNDWKFYNNKEPYKCTLRVQDAIEGVDFFLIDEEVENG